MRSNASRIQITPLHAIPEHRDELSSRSSGSGNKSVDPELTSVDAGFSSGSNGSPRESKRNNELELHGFDFSRPAFEEPAALNPITKIIHNSSELRNNIDETIKNTIQKDELNEQEIVRIK